MRTLKVNLLYHCTAQCQHCRFGCTNEGEPVLPDFELPYLVAERLKAALGLDMAVVLGGEPGLFHSETVKLLQRLKSLGIATRLETNGFWAGSYEDAVRFLEPLVELETYVMLSLDGFHDPYVPLDHVINAAKACKALGVNYNLELPYLDIHNKDNDVDRRTEELFTLFCNAVGDEIPKYMGPVLFVGRAAETFGEQFALGRGIPQETCTAVPWWPDGELDTTDLVILEPGGYITKGCGIAIGNAYERDVAEILKGYNAWEHPVFSVLMKEGPAGLAKMAEQYGFHMKKDYADKCHLCYEARKSLKPYFDSLLKPDQHYHI